MFAIDNVGYRHLDCAHIYNNEKEIGEALKRLETPRSQIFITSKLWNNYHRPENVRKGFEKSLKHLDVEYLDLYLMHWPTAFLPNQDYFSEDYDNEYIVDDVDYVETYKEMEKLVEEGLVRNIGVSNFTIKKLQRILNHCKIKPAVNQIEKHPYLIQPDLYEFCKRNNIHITAYSPLGSTSNKLKLLDDETIVGLATKYNTTPAVVLLSWAAIDSSVIPRSTKKQNIKANFDLVALKDDDIAKINKLNKNERCFKGFKDDFKD